MPILDPDGQPRRSGPNSLLQWVRHHPYPMVLARCLSFIMALLVDSGWSWLFALVFLITLLLSGMADAAHRHGVCDRCLRQPYGGPETAEKKVSQLQVFHWSREWPGEMVVLGIYAAIFACYLVGAIFLHNMILLASVFTVSEMGMALDERIGRTHAWLRPWCPWCKDDGYFTESSPDPAPSGTKVVS